MFHCNEETDCARFSDNGYKVATAGLNLEQPIDISDDEKLGQVFDQSECQNMYIYICIRGGDDDSVEATLGLSLPS